MKKTTHKLNILQKLYDTGLHLTATDFRASNANQYLGELEGQELVTRYWVRNEGETPYKLAYVSDTTKDKAKKYLHAFGKIPK